MPIVLLRLLLLTMVLPVVAVAAGRPIPAAPITATLTPTPQVEITATLKPTPQVEITAQGIGFEGGLTWRYGQEYYLSRPPPPPPSRTLVRGNVKLGASIYGHRLLVGSAPPSCLGKCGTCVPCTPVHVSIGSSPGGHAGSVTEQEYYPEVWRCKCGNRFFMP